jgi:threonyl-tRNA synthetase
LYADESYYVFTIENRFQGFLGGHFDAMMKYIMNETKKTEKKELPDHRKIGKELDLFVFSDLVGSGLPLFTPRGTVVREGLLAFSEELQKKNGYQKVAIPHITKKDLYEKSGHWAKFGEELFLVKSQETKDQMVLKPMNCPHHTQIYAGRPRSYKELPIRYMESTIQYRDEKKGELNGLSRVRSISIDDSHVFCTLDQIEDEFATIMAMIKEMYSVFDMKFRARLSFRDDSEKYLGDPEIWENAQSTIEKVAKKMGLDYFVQEGDAAFYGPKIDIMATDSLGREWQLATEQLDFIQPQRFELTYIDADGSEKTPVMIHKALLGSVERFLSVYLEHTNGRFPVWLAPEQLRITTLNDEEKVLQAARDLVKKAKEQGIRAELDDSNESVGKKVRDAEHMKVPYTIVIGGKEVESGKVTPRVRSDLAKLEKESWDAEDFLAKITQDAKSRK